MAWLETIEQRSALSERIRRKMATQGWTQARLAKASGYDERTIRNVLNAQSTRHQTVVEICKALDLSLDGGEPEAADVAADQYGAYARSSFAHYEGRYFGYRRMFSKSRRILRTCYSILWNPKNRSLVFSEDQDIDAVLNAEVDGAHSHGGDIYISAHTGLIHLVTIYQGAVRLVTLTKMRGQTLRGVVLTQSERTLFYQPSVSALLLKKIDRPVDSRSFEDRIGPLRSDDPDYERLHTELREIEGEVIFFAQSQDA